MTRTEPLVRSLSIWSQPALAGCTAFDVTSILRKKRMHVTDYEVQVEADQAAQPPAVFVKVRLHHVLTVSLLTARQ